MTTADEARAAGAGEHVAGCVVSAPIPNEPGQLCLKVRPKHGGPWLVCVSQAEIDDSLDGADRADYEIVELFMTQTELDALGDFEGW